VLKLVVADERIRLLTRSKRWMWWGSRPRWLRSGSLAVAEIKEETTADLLQAAVLLAVLSVGGVMLGIGSVVVSGVVLVCGVVLYIWAEGGL
jgi:hypothetical protein